MDYLILIFVCVGMVICPGVVFLFLIRHFILIYYTSFDYTVWSANLQLIWISCMPEDKLFYKNINISFKTQKNRQCHIILLCKCTLQYIIDKEIGIIFFIFYPPRPSLKIKLLYRSCKLQQSDLDLCFDHWHSHFFYPPRPSLKMEGVGFVL